MPGRYVRDETKISKKDLKTIARLAKNEREKKEGIYRKFVVKRVDGSTRKGGKHEGCFFFVLDLNHDKFASPALAAYADACKLEYPKLAEELRGLVHEYYVRSMQKSGLHCEAGVFGCKIKRKHIHCPECGSTKHTASECDAG